MMACTRKHHQLMQAADLVDGTVVSAQLLSELQNLSRTCACFSSVHNAIRKVSWRAGRGGGSSDGCGICPRACECCSRRGCIPEQPLSDARKLKLNLHRHSSIVYGTVSRLPPSPQEMHIER